MTIPAHARTLLLATAATLALAACSDPNKPSNANFQKSIQAALDKQPACVVSPVEAFPFEMGKDEKLLSISGDRKAQLDALVAAKLLTVEEARVTIKPMFGQPQEVDGLRYALTDEGTRVIGESAVNDGRDRFPRLCYGTPSVVEIVRFTTPSEAMGMTISQVVYKKQITKPADWSQVAEVQAAWPRIAQEISPKDNENDVLILTSDGWVHERMMKN